MKIDRLFLASSNPGKLREYRRFAPGSPISLECMAGFAQLPIFDEAAPTFAENAVGKALHYARFVDGVVLAEDSGLVVPALNGAPGVKSARYAGQNASDADRIRKLLSEMSSLAGQLRAAKFVCVTALAREKSVIAVVSDDVYGTIAIEPRGANGFGYDPVLLVPSLCKTLAEATPEEKDRCSHRAKAFRKILSLIETGDISNPRAACGL